MKWLIIAVVILAQQPSKLPERKGATETKVAESAGQAQKSDNAGNNGPPISVTINNSLPAPNDDSRKNQSAEDANTQRWLVRYTGLLVVVGIVTAGFIWWQARETRGSVQAIRESLPHQETAAKAAEKNANALINSERAWIMADLGWFDAGLHVSLHTTRIREGTEDRHTAVNVKLTCRNEGRSPAWIDNVRARIDLISAISTISYEPPPISQLDNYGPMEPLGPSSTTFRSLDLDCPGHAREGEFFSVYVLVQYRDIFGLERETHLGYSVQPDGVNIHRQNALRERNRNT